MNEFEDPPRTSPRLGSRIPCPGTPFSNLLSLRVSALKNAGVLAAPAVVTHGELLIDFVSTRRGFRLQESKRFVRAPGGAPANVSVGLARLGISAAFMGKVGDDEFGRFLAKILREHGVDVRALRFDAEARTALAFVALHEDGEREFTFYRHPSADMHFAPEDIDRELIQSALVFHFGSISLIQEPARSATLAAVDLAHQHGSLVSFDPNLRLNLWPNASEAKRWIERGWAVADLVKLSGEELSFLTGEEDVELAAGKALPASLMVVTLGPGGCFFATDAKRGYVPGYPVHCLDTTGAGDGFMAGLLAGLLGHAGCQNIEEALRLGNAVGALVTTRRGAIPAMPSLIQVKRLIARSH